MIRHIAAIDKNRGIAKNGVQPWKLPTDEQYFTDMTKKFGGVVLMGRRTYEVIGHPLPERKNFVLTHQADYRAGGATVVTDIGAVLQVHPDVWIIGGAELYTQTLSLADELYLTEIDADFGCDVFYPDFSRLFTRAHQGTKFRENDLTYRFTVYTR